MNSFLYLPLLFVLQRKYFIKFSADGAMVSRDRFGVGGCIKVFSSDSVGKPKEYTNIPHLLYEHPVFYYFGECIFINILMICVAAHDACKFLINLCQDKNHLKS